jgi:hypothetical protein
MSTEQMESRLANIELTVAELQKQLADLAAAEPKKPSYERVGRGMSPEERQEFDEYEEICRYIRKVGQEPPPEWKPGDPIPEPIYEP